MFKAYDRILRRHPIGVQAVTTAGLFVLGDVIAQQVIEKKMSIKSHDFGRSAKLGAFGLCLA
ncbi:hypothetical protein HDU79_006053 [Rhizoclosmatium sp. JEL0117]|nr:hypothetical protein HDU79_006053 [Rhizoclosmatium sp. JEL0117]